MNTILQWNIRGLRANWEELSLLVEETEPSIICLQETLTGQAWFPAPSGYHAIHKDSNDGHHGGSAIISRLDVPSTELHLTTSLQAVAMRVYGERTYTICSVYLPPNEDISRQRLEHLIQELPIPFILLGDMNARHYF